MSSISFFYLSICSLFLLLSCEEKSTTTPTVKLPKAQLSTQRLFLNTTINRLRVRQTPDLEGAVLKILSTGQIVEYKHDSTLFNTAIDYNNQAYNSSWYKIKTNDNTEGWVYAAFLSLLPTEENQSYLQKKEAEELKELSNLNNTGLLQKKGRKKETPVQLALVEQYQKYVDKLPKNDPKSISKAISKYKSSIIGRNSNTCDAAYVVFDDFYQQVLLFVRPQVAGKYQHLYDEVKRYHSSTMLHDDFCQTLHNNGFNFGLQDGKVILVENVDYLYRIFYRECSMTMRTWMNQYQKEIPNFWLDNERLCIPPKTLVRWVLSWNYFVVQYPQFVWHKRAKKQLNLQLNLLLKGNTSTLIFDDKTKEIRADFLEAYQFIVDNYPKSTLGKAFGNYLQVLEENDRQFSDNLIQLQNKIIEEFSS